MQCGVAPGFVQCGVAIVGSRGGTSRAPSLRSGGSELRGGSEAIVAAAPLPTCIQAMLLVFTVVNHHHQLREHDGQKQQEQLPHRPHGVDVGHHRHHRRGGGGFGWRNGRTELAQQSNHLGGHGAWWTVLAAHRPAPAATH
eukprot:scaffold8378_cov113-Isochrysis_galbana.AAC.4